MAKINGKIVDVEIGTTIKQYIAQNGFNLKFIAVECNGEIVPKAKYEEQTISPDDVIEIVNFVGGG